MARKAKKPRVVDRAERNREAARKRSSRLIREGQDIGEIPSVSDPERRARAEASFRVFCETYFREVFFLSWSKDLLRIISKIESVVTRYETVAIVMPRGSGKTRLCVAAVVWAILTGRHRFVVLVGAIQRQSLEAIEGFKRIFSENALLLADFPEVCYPIWRIEGEPRKCKGQRYKEKPTNIGWKQDRLVMPTIEGSQASEAVILAVSLDGHIRGLWYQKSDGTVVRPTLALADDPQTDESARSQGPRGQTTTRIKLLNTTVRGCAGPNAQLGMLIPCTIIERGDLADQLTDRQLFPEFRGEHTKRFYAWPENMALWDQYREMRDDLLRRDKPMEPLIEFYRSRMATCGLSPEDARPCKTCSRRVECMDCGAIVDWAARLDDPSNLTAIQAGMHTLYKYGAAGFASEFQGEPLEGQPGQRILTAQACASKLNGRSYGEVPLACTELTMMIDPGQYALYYCVCGWEPNFTGYVVDYGTWPRQPRAMFSYADLKGSPTSLEAKYHGVGTDAAIQAGLEELVREYMGRGFQRSGGAGAMRIGRMLVDSGRWTGVIAAVKHRVGGETMVLSKGAGVTAKTRPWSMLKRKPGERHGTHWYQPTTKGTREFPFTMIDTNYWKSCSHDALLAAPGEAGCLTLWGTDAMQHANFAAHITAETWVETSGHGRKLHEWTPKPHKPDNHWFDCLVGCFVAASMQNISRPGQQDAPAATRHKVLSPEDVRKLYGQ
jgi:hypothetical protein